MILQYFSGLKEDSCELSVDEVFGLALKLAGKCLNQKKLAMLKLIAEDSEKKTITAAVEHISCELHCPKSTVWTNVNCLKQLGLIQNGRGKPVKITKAGAIILKQISHEKNAGEQANGVCI